jgi:hypothetical protein
MLEKPMIIFTTFWDAVCLVDLGGIIIEDKVFEFDRDEVSVSSIALAQPKMPNQITFPELDFFAPTWDLLKTYKSDRDWNSYTKIYKGFLKEDQKRIATWLKTLDKGKINILCCWENTCNGANCHRKILYDLLSNSKRTKDIASYIYRDGDSKSLNRDKQLIAFKQSFSSELVLEPSEPSERSNDSICEEITRACGERQLNSIWGTIRLQDNIYALEIVDLTYFFQFKLFSGNTGGSFLRTLEHTENYEIFFDPLLYPTLANIHLVAKKSGVVNVQFETNPFKEYYELPFATFKVREIKELIQ